MKKGFTILEILVAISVIGILVGISIPRFKGMQDEANVIKAESELKTLQAAVESYARNSRGVYPGTTNQEINSLSSDYLLSAFPKIIDSALVDPFNSPNEYKYSLAADGRNYVLSSIGPGKISKAHLSGGAIVTGGTPDICVTNSDNGC